jgi:arsenate reductase
MGEIATSNRQITLFYNSESATGKQTLAYAMTEGFPIQEIDILKTKLTGTQIVELADRLHIEVGDLINKEHTTYKTNFNSDEFSTNDWIKMIQHNPEIMKQPIALRGDITILVKTPTDILKI